MPGITVAEEPGKAAAMALPCESFRISFLISYNHPLVPAQQFDITVDPGAYSAQVAPARTYGFIEEVEALRKAGLAKGGSTDNALVIYQDRYSSELRFSNEPVRHKAADMLGDIALLGRRVRGHFIGYRSGHALSAQLMKKLLQDI